MERRRIAASIAVVGALLLALSTLPDAPVQPQEAGGEARREAGQARTTRTGGAAPEDAGEAAPRPPTAVEREAAAQREALAVAAEELAADPDVHAICELDPPLQEASAYLAVGEHSGFNGRRVPVVLGRAYLPHLEGAGEGVLAVEGYAPTPVRWTAATADAPGSCAPAPIRLEAGATAVTGTVTHEGSGEPARRAWVEGCGALADTDADGGFYMQVVPGPCRLLAMRQDGSLRTVSPMVEVVPVEGEDVVVDLQIPGWPRAGLGVVVREVEEGVLIDDVLPGSGAEEEGLEPGDVLVEVDAVPTVELDLAEFVELAGGREGSVVEFLVDRGGERRLVTVERVTF